LGLLALYDLDRSPTWLNAAAKALSYLARSRAGLNTVPADHWALIATARLFPHCDRHTCPVSRDELLQHAVQMCNSILKDQYRGSAPVGIDGAFDPSGRTAPTATRLEGLLASLEFVPRGELQVRIKGSAQRGIAFLLRTQSNSAPHTGECQEHYFFVQKEGRRFGWTTCSTRSVRGSVTKVVSFRDGTRELNRHPFPRPPRSGPKIGLLQLFKKIMHL
jgi:hypothetical protein